jgi:hypothetical protein
VTLGIIDMMIKIKGTTLKIHCWGGLGSQLQALSFYLLVQAKLPTRKIELFLHSSGITKRESEIDFLGGQINIRSIEDFVDNQITSTHNSLNVRFSKIIKKYMRLLLNFFKLVITNENHVMSIMPWTTDIRCSYSKIHLNSKLIKSLGLLLKFNPEQVKQDIIGVHYRAGDLLTLKSESLIPLKIIVEQIENLNTDRTKLKRVVIYSDSDLELVDFQTSSNLEFELKKIDTLNTIFELSSANVFIGTNSKVSLWVAIFKYGFEIPGLILLPSSMLDNFFSLINPSAPIDGFIVDSYNY